MIFPKLSYEKLVQESDKLRLHANFSFITGDEDITDVEIRPSLTDAFVSVYDINDTNNCEDVWYIDWAYALEGDYTITVRVTGSVSGAVEKDFSVTVVTEATDKLFSDDQDIFPFEPNIYNYLPSGKCSFIYAHRAAQEKILQYLDEQRIWRYDSTQNRYVPFTKETIDDIAQFKRWSTFQALLIIFESNQLASNDLFQEKRSEYENEMRQARNRSSLVLDVSGDGSQELKNYNVRSTRLVRR